jgi:spore germination protein KB
LFTIIGAFLIGSTVIITPSAGAKQNAWIAFLIGMAGGVLLLCIYVAIVKLNPLKTWVEILKEHFGKIAGSILAGFYIWYFIHLATLVLRNFGEYFIVINYTETPLVFVNLFFMLVIIYVAKLGVEVIGRISEVFLVILTVNVVLVFFLLLGMLDVENLKPVLEEGIQPILKSSFSIMTFPFGESVVLLMIFPYVNKQQKVFKTSIYSFLFVGFIFLLTITRNLMILGADMAARDVFPSHIVYRLIPELDLDPIIDINFIMAGVVKVSLCLYSAVTGLKYLFGLNHYKSLVVPVAAFILPLSVWIYGSLPEMVEWATDIWPIYSIPFQIIIPVIILIISKIKQAKQQ